MVDIESHVSSGQQGILSSLAIYCGNDYQRAESVILVDVASDVVLFTGCLVYSMAGRI